MKTLLAGFHQLLDESLKLEDEQKRLSKKLLRIRRAQPQNLAMIKSQIRREIATEKELDSVNRNLFSINIRLRNFARAFR